MTSFLLDTPTGREFTINRGEVTLRAVDFGDPVDSGQAAARTVVAVHGFASNLQANWVAAGWVRLLLAEGYRVVAFDHRGHGGSDKPRDADRYDMPLLIDDLAAVVAAAGAEPVDLIGYSLGSRLAAEYAVRFPEMVRTLNLGGMDNHDPLTAFDVAAARGFVIDKTPIADEATASLMTMASALPGNDLAALLACATGLHQSVAHVRHEVRPTAPTLVVCGSNDVIAPHGAEFVASLPAGSFVELKGRTHINALTSRAFKTAVVEHLAAH